MLPWYAYTEILFKGIDYNYLLYSIKHINLRLTVFSRLTICTSILPNNYKHISDINFTSYPIIALSHVMTFIRILISPSPCTFHSHFFRIIIMMHLYREHLVATYFDAHVPRQMVRRFTVRKRLGNHDVIVSHLLNTNCLFRVRLATHTFTTFSYSTVFT